MITTGGGDMGKTSLADGSRRRKDDLVIEVLGEIDETHAFLGLLKSALENSSKRNEIEWIEHCLLTIGGMVATAPTYPGAGKSIRVLGDAELEKLEKWQMKHMKKTEISAAFVIYGDSEAAARADVARAVCRRAERRLVTLIMNRGMTDLVSSQVFLNRLSDYLFVLARTL
ncbi:hypothetical protein JY97_11170 [Alkalispirochaeta odontotermitis]|nr:hypothetical protein JY97_11170 [Alkalispirochaeta odontotermitis]